MARPLQPAAKRSSRENGREMYLYGEFVMDLRVQLKICEGCGCLWYRAQTQGSVYCRQCETKLREFPAPETRKRRGRPGRKPLKKIWAVAEATGGAE
jgi:hypothetical protein